MARSLTNGYNDDGVKNDVTVTISNSPTGACPSTGKDITVTIILHVPMTFAKVLGRSEVATTVSATARSCDLYTSGGTPLYAGASVYTTKTGSCGNGLTGKSLYVQGSAHLQVWGGDLASASSDGNCVYFKGGQVQLKKAESGTACSDVLTAASNGGTFNSLQGEDGCGAKVYNQSFAPLCGFRSTSKTGSAIHMLYLGHGRKRSGGNCL